MPFLVPIDQAQADYPDYQFLAALTPSEQKAAFHVRDKQGHDLCLKIIAPSYDAGRFQREIQAMQELQHTNVVQLVEYTFSSSHGKQRHYAIEEFVDGQDLSERLIAGQKWPLADAATFFAELCDGLAALQAKGIVHRDLKPSNVRVRPNGSPVIIDFGLARHLGQPDLTRTSQGAAIGTPLFFAPEQFSGTKRDIDHRTDLFALGVLLYQAVTGEHPFYRGQKTYQDLAEAVCVRDDHLTSTAYTSLPREWQMVLGRLLERERARRPADAASVAKMLRKLAGKP